MGLRPSDLLHLFSLETTRYVLSRIRTLVFHSSGVGETGQCERGVRRMDVRQRKRFLENRDYRMAKKYFKRSHSLARKLSSIVLIFNSIEL